jgi:hypothetical protein
MGTGAELVVPELLAGEVIAGEAVSGVFAAGAGELAGAAASYAGAGEAVSGLYAAGSGELAGAAASYEAGSMANILNTAKTVATIASPFASLAAAASVANAARRVGGITNQPAVTPAVTMPTFGNVDTMNALRSNIQQQLVRRGRQATILTSQTGSGDKLGN